MTKPLTAVDLCCGIGGFSLAAARNNIKTLFACDTDPQAVKIYFQNLGIIPHGDLRRIVQQVPPHDILTAGLPCQPFSIIGKRQGLQDPQGGLIHAIADIIEHRRPKAALLENVDSLAKHDSGATLKYIISLLEARGYAVSWTILDARRFGLPQQRRRIFIAALAPGYGPLNWPLLPQPCPPLDTLLEPAAAGHYYASAAVRNRTGAKIKKPPPQPAIWHTNRAGAVTARPYSAALRASASHNYLLVNGERRPTEREMLRLQGFPEDFRLDESYQQAKKHAGNAVAVPAAAAALRSVKHALKRPATPEAERREALSRIRKLADALRHGASVWQASEDIIDMAAQCSAALKRLLENPPTPPTTKVANPRPPE